MRLRRQWSVGLVAAVVVAGTAVTRIAAAEPTAASAPMRPVANQGEQRTMTLVTGDRVTLSGDGRSASAEPGPGRDGITFTVTTGPGGVRVVPGDAVPLLEAGRLDPRLFDVTGLVAAGYDRRDDLPLILTGDRRSTVAAVGGLTKERDLPAVKGAAVRQPRAGAAASWRTLTGGDPAARTLRSNVGKVWLDGVRRPTLDVSVPQVGAPAAWQAGYTGAGVTVAVLDSGVDDTHPDLAGQVVARRNFTEEAEPDDDLSGHGTHVASTIAGTGAASGGKYRGVAPGAKLLDGKVCITVVCLDSWIIAGMTWAAAERDAAVVNLSLGGQDDPTVVDPVEEAVQALSDQYGTLFVIAAGNTDGGVVRGAISSPGTAEAALTVGAVDSRDALAGFSRRGPTADERIKPDITAPGVEITAARGKDAGRVPGTAGARYTTLSGTSMATPHVAGAAAIVAQQHTGWPGRRLKAALMASARPSAAFTAYDQGAGRLDVARAVGQRVTGAPAGLSFGTQAWPHQDDEVRTREVTYHNDGATDVTLELALAVAGPDGTPAPAGLFTAGAASVAVPAGGDATVTVTADTRTAGPDGRLSGWLTASAGGEVVVRTPVAVHKEVESYDVTLNHIGRGDGELFYLTTVSDRVNPDGVYLDTFGQDGTEVVRLPKGHYSLFSTVQTATETPGENPDDKPTWHIQTTLVGQPDLSVDGALAVTIDARLGRPVSVTVPRADAAQIFAELAAYTRRPGGTAGMVVLADTFTDLYTARIGPDVRDDSFVTIVAGQWARGRPDGSTDDSPYLYALFFPEVGRMLDGYQRAVTDRELARVRADIARAHPGETGVKWVSTGSSQLGVGNFGPRLTVHPPFSRVEYYNAGAGIGSGSQYGTVVDGGIAASVMANTYTEYETGRTYHERWNTGVFGPYLPASQAEWAGVVRQGRYLRLDVPTYTDGAGRAGSGVTTKSSATLFRDGTKVASTTWDRTGTLEMPDEDGTYRLELHAERGAPFELSTRTDIAWTFRAGGEPVPAAPAVLPVWTVRFAPDVDRHNALPAGGRHAVPVIVTPQRGAAVGTLVSLTAEASFDDGATWKAVRVKNGAALVPHPAGRGFVSLRATAADSAGNTVEQTVIRAYRY